MEYFESSDALMELLKPLLEGTGVTLTIFGFTLLFAIPLGFIICFGKMSRVKIARWLSQAYIVLFRGTPLMLQLIFFYFGMLVINIQIDRMNAAIIAFSLNYAAYFAEIFRGGIQSVPKGQYEAADMLGFTHKQCFFKIVLPQVCKNVLPPVGNEVVTLVKDTALIYIIAISDLMREAQIVMMRDTNLMPLAVAAVFYLLLTSTFTFIFNRIEKKLSYYKL